jgi:hypothetical protein
VTRIDVGVDLDATPEVVWADVSDIRSHVEWMADAEEIRFTSMRRHGIGTAFDCVTKVGPISLVDSMVCTEWIPGRVIGIRHQGLVTGDGRFELTALPGGRTRFTWTETLSFPLVLGGPVGAAVGGRVVLRRIWQQNLQRLAARYAGRAG